MSLYTAQILSANTPDFILPLKPPDSLDLNSQPGRLRGVDCAAAKRLASDA